MEAAPTKKLKMTQGLDAYTYKNFSEILTQSFEQSESQKYIGYLYRVIPAPNFAVILPIKAVPFPSHLLEYLGVCSLSHQSIEDIKHFQHVMWTDFLRSPKVIEADISEANYFVVPLDNKDEIAWEEMYVTLGRDIPLQIFEVSAEFRENLVIKSKTSGAIWKVIFAFDDSLTSDEFLTRLIGPDNEDLEVLKQFYSGYSPLDIILDDHIYIESLVEFRKSISNRTIPKISTNSLLLFAKQVKSSRHVEAVDLSKPKIFKTGTPLLYSELYEVHPFSNMIWSQGTNLLIALVELETNSYLFEFSDRYKYQGNFYYLRDTDRKSVV